jgi:hypothetical protein
MTDAPETIWATPETKSDAGMVSDAYKGMPYATEYTRTDIAQANQAVSQANFVSAHAQAIEGKDRIAELEAALQGMIDFYVEIDSAGGAPGDADISAMEPSVVVARAALKAKP